MHISIENGKWLVLSQAELHWNSCNLLLCKARRCFHWLATLGLICVRRFVDSGNSFFTSMLLLRNSVSLCKALCETEACIILQRHGANCLLQAWGPFIACLTLFLKADRTMSCETLHTFSREYDWKMLEWILQCAAAAAAPWFWSPRRWWKKHLEGQQELFEDLVSASTWDSQGAKDRAMPATALNQKWEKRKKYDRQMK